MVRTLWYLLVIQRAVCLPWLLSSPLDKTPPPSSIPSPPVTSLKETGSHKVAQAHLKLILQPRQALACYLSDLAPGVVWITVQHH